MPIVISRNSRASIIMHGVICKNRKGFTFICLNRKQSNSSIDRPGGANYIGIFMPGMHIRPYSFIAKWISKHFIGLINPSSAKSMFIVVKCSPTYSSGNFVFMGQSYGSNNLRCKKRFISFICPRAQNSHSSGGRMGMRCTDHNITSRYAGCFLNHEFDGVKKITGHHATINNNKCNLCFSIIKN